MAEAQGASAYDQRVRDHITEVFHKAVAVARLPTDSSLLYGALRRLSEELEMTTPQLRALDRKKADAA